MTTKTLTKARVSELAKSLRDGLQLCKAFHDAQSRSSRMRGYIGGELINLVSELAGEEAAAQIRVALEHGNA